VNAVINLRIPKNAGKFLSSWGRVSFPGKPLLLAVLYTSFWFVF
jgi:hypothetical protein